MVKIIVLPNQSWRWKMSHDLVIATICPEILMMDNSLLSLSHLHQRFILNSLTMKWVLDWMEERKWKFEREENCLQIFDCFAIESNSVWTWSIFHYQQRKKNRFNEGERVREREWQLESTTRLIFKLSFRFSLNISSHKTSFSCLTVKE